MHMHAGTAIASDGADLCGENMGRGGGWCALRADLSGATRIGGAVYSVLGRFEIEWLVGGGW